MVEKTVPRRFEQRQDVPRRRRGGNNTDPFHIDPAEIPHGSSWEWKRFSSLGAEDHEHGQLMKEMGWLPVTWAMRWDAKRPPGLTEIGLQEPCKRKGMILMERPLELTQEAILEDHDRADGQVADKLRELGQAPAETMPRAHPHLQNKVKRDYAPAGMPVPSDD